MQTKKISLPFFFARSTDEEALPVGLGARLVNGYIDKIDVYTVIKKTPGLELVADLGVTSPVDVFWWDKQNIAVLVCNGQIYKMINRDGNTVNLTGDALTVVGKTTFADNGSSFVTASGGRMVSLYVENKLVTTPGLATGSTNTHVASSAFTYYIGPTLYSKSAVAAGTAPGNDVIPQNKYGAVALDIGADGTIDVIEAANNATGYDSAALAIAGIAAVAYDHVRMGTVTAMKSDGAFTFGTTALNAANTTVAYTNGSLLTLASDGWPTTLFISDADAPTEVSHVAFLDQYLLANRVNTGYFHYCDFASIRDWTSTSFFSGESKPDNIKSLLVINREVVLVGDNSIEVWVTSPSGPVFQRQEGACADRGTIAQNSPININGVMYWMDNERHICRMDGREPKIISGHYDNIIRDFYPVTDCIGLHFSVGKHIFAVFTFPTENKTFIYNVINETWSEWGDWSSSDLIFSKWKGYSACYAKAWDMVLIGGYDGKIYKIKPSIFQNDGEVIRTVIRTGYNGHGNYKDKQSVELRIRCKGGAGGVSGNEPVFTYRYRNEDNIWKPERQVSLGKQGEYEILKRIHRMGIYQLRQYEFVHTDNSDFIMIGLEEDFEEA